VGEGYEEDLSNRTRAVQTVPSPLTITAKGAVPPEGAIANCRGAETLEKRTECGQHPMWRIKK